MHVENVVIDVEWCFQGGTSYIYSAALRVTSNLPFDVLFGNEVSTRESDSSQPNVFDEAVRQGRLKKRPSWKTRISHKRLSWSIESRSRKNSLTTAPKSTLADVRAHQFLSSPIPDQGRIAIGTKPTASEDSPPLLNANSATQTVYELGGTSNSGYSTGQPVSPRERYACALPEIPNSMNFTQFPESHARPPEIQISPILGPLRQRDEPDSIGDEVPIRTDRSSTVDDQLENLSGSGHRENQVSGDSAISGISSSTLPSELPYQHSLDKSFPQSPRASSPSSQREEIQISHNHVPRKFLVAIPQMGSLRECPEDDTSLTTALTDEIHSQFPADYWTSDPVTERLYHVNENGNREYFEGLD